MDRFLTAMQRASARSFPGWLEVLRNGLEDCVLDFDSHRALFDVQPLDDYYFAGAVGLETVRMRTVYPARHAEFILALIGERIDAVAGRPDRLCSDLLFSIVSRIDMAALASDQKPHDGVVAIILERIGLATASGTRHLMADLLFRHHLGQFLALEIPQWWPAFRAKFALVDLPADATPSMTVASMSSPTPRRLLTRRLV